MSNKPIFSANPNTHCNAYLNWRMSDNMIENLYQMGIAYGKGAMILLDNCLSQDIDYRADALIFPIMHGIDHCIELCLKSVIHQIELLDDSEISSNGTHDISQLLSCMKSKIKKHMDGKTKGLEKHLEPVQNYIDELYGYIQERTDLSEHTQKESERPHIEYSRYPMDMNGVPFFYAATYENVTINLPVLKERFQAIIDSLKSLYYCYSAELDFKNEMLHEMRMANNYGEY